MVSQLDWAHGYSNNNTFKQCNQHWYYWFHHGQCVNNFPFCVAYLTFIVCSVSFLWAQQIVWKMEVNNTQQHSVMLSICLFYDCVTKPVFSFVTLWTQTSIEVCCSFKIARGPDSKKKENSLLSIPSLITRSIFNNLQWNKFPLLLYYVFDLSLMRFIIELLLVDTWQLLFDSNRKYCFFG